MTQFVRSARLGDCAYLAPLLRAADLEEIKASSGLDPLDALTRAYAGSTMAYTALAATGLPWGMGGVIGAPERPSMVWFLGTDEIEKQPITFLRQSREVANRLNAVWPHLEAISDDRNTVHQRWLEWVGFKPLYTHSWGVEGRPFTHFRKTLPHV